MFEKKYFKRFCWTLSEFYRLKQRIDFTGDNYNGNDYTDDN